MRFFIKSFVLLVVLGFVFINGALAQTTISNMPQGNSAMAGDIFPVIRGTGPYINYKATLPLGSATTAGLLSCGTGVTCSAGVISGASPLPSTTSAAFEYLTNNGNGSYNWSNPAGLIDPRTFAPAGTLTCVGSGATGGLPTVYSSSGYANGIILSGGSSYTNGTYTSVPMTNVSSTGSGATATIVVAGGSVTTVTFTASGTAQSSGSGYKLRDKLSASASSLGGTGSGFLFQVSRFGANQQPVYDGIHDDTPYFQAAVNYAQNTGQPVMVPDGCWVTTINIPQGVTMMGQGYATTYGYDYDSGTADPMPVLYEENGSQFVIHFGANSNNGFFGFEINDSANYAYQNGYCIGTDQSSYAGSPHIFVRGMAMSGCFAGLGTPNNSAFFPISIDNIYGASVHGIYGYVNDLMSIGDTFGSNTDGINAHGGLWNIIGDRFEFNGQGINCNCSGISVTSSQFDSNSNGAIEFIDGSGYNNIVGNTFQGNGYSGTVGLDAAIIDGRNTSDETDYPPAMNISANTFNAVGNGGNQPYVLDVTTSGVNNDYLMFQGGNALNASTSGFAIYRAGQPPHMKIDIPGQPFYDSTQTTFTVSGACTPTNPIGNATTGAFTSGTAGTCNVTVVPNGAASVAQPNGWNCGNFVDVTTNADTSSWHQTGYTTTTALISGTTALNDVVSFTCRPF